MSDQHSFAGIAWTHKGKQTRRARFLANDAEIQLAIPNMVGYTL